MFQNMDRGNARSMLIQIESYLESEFNATEGKSAKQAKQANDSHKILSAGSPP